jgi:DNA-binding transcriptional MerR regulator
LELALLIPVLKTVVPQFFVSCGTTVFNQLPLLSNNHQWLVDEVEKRYYSIGEVAELLQVNPSLLRFWETEVPFIHPRKNKKGDRQYSRQDLDMLRLVYDLVKEKGYTLQGARDFIKSKEHKVQQHAEIIVSLQKLKTFLTELRDGLESKRERA